mmetsp:Transcript_15921/g.40801  ORF Transcript_15921/g.40801 Transcript_15921/m.40801 type:complete len:228 (-) Transcript_15921:955-1638(-)
MGGHDEGLLQTEDPSPLSLQCQRFSDRSSAAFSALSRVVGSLSEPLRSGCMSALVCGCRESWRSTKGTELFRVSSDHFAGTFTSSGSAHQPSAHREQDQSGRQRSGLECRQSLCTLCRRKLTCAHDGSEWQPSHCCCLRVSGEDNRARLSAYLGYSDPGQLSAGEGPHRSNAQRHLPFAQSYGPQSHSTASSLTGRWLSSTGTSSVRDRTVCQSFSSRVEHFQQSAG